MAETRWNLFCFKLIRRLWCGTGPGFSNILISLVNTIITAPVKNVKVLFYQKISKPAAFSGDLNPPVGGLMFIPIQVTSGTADKGLKDPNHLTGGKNDN